MSKKIKIAIALVAFAGIAIVAYFSFSDKKEKVDYLTETVKIGNIRKTVNATGEVSAVQLVNVGAQASGQIKKLYVELGQSIKKGDMIADIDSTTQTNDLATNKAKLETYKAQLVSAQVALKVAQTQYSRETTLLANDATSKENLENARNTLASAKARVAELNSQINQTKISVNTSEVNLGYTRIVAPRDGTVVSIPVEEGQTVNANQTTPTIVQIADLSQMQIKMQISEGDVTKIKPGMAVSYTILSESDKVYHTTLKSVDPGLTTLTDGSYEKSTDSTKAVYYYGKLEVPNEDGTLHIGMTTQNTIIVAGVEKSLIVPTIAIQDKAGKKMVRLLGAKNQITEQEIKTGLSDNMNTQVLSGLKENDQVISSQMTDSEISESVSNVSGRGKPRK